MGICPSCSYISETEQMRLDGWTKKESVNGPGCVFVPPCVTGNRKKAELLDESQYIHIKNEYDGEMEVIKGPQLYFPGPYSMVMGRHSVISLSKNEWARIQDSVSGRRRVEIGEQKVYLSPTEKLLNRGEGYLIDEHHAVLVKETTTAEHALITKQGMYVPGPYEEVLQIQQKCLLEDYEVLILMDPQGRFSYYHGSNTNERCFFVPPFWKEVSLQWSNPVVVSRVAVEKLLPPTHRTVTKFDLRPSYMNYEFIARTVDNVELAIAITFFWRIIDVQAMILKSADTPGDICTHARSVIIQAVAGYKLLDFLTAFNAIVTKHILGSNDMFYAERGVELMNVEVMKFHCVDKDTDKILQEIIQETTERLKALEKQRSDNEVNEARIDGEIAVEKAKAHLEMLRIQASVEQETANKQLIDIKKDHEKREALIEGEAEAGKIISFLDTIGSHTSSEVKMELYGVLRRLDAIKAVSSGNASLYYTPSDINLSIETLQTAHGRSFNKISN